MNGTATDTGSPRARSEPARTEPAGAPTKAAETVASPPRRSRVRRGTASFWLNTLFFLSEHWPLLCCAIRRISLLVGWQFSQVFRSGPVLNARHLLGPDSTLEEQEACAFATIESFYISVYELGRALRRSPEELQKQVDVVDGHERYHRIRAARRGAIIVTAHLGPFELGVAALVPYERKIHVVYQRDVNARFDRLRSRLRRHLGIAEAPVDDGLATWARLRDALLRDEVIMLQGDRVMPGQTGVRVPFLDGHILMPTGPVKLAMITGAPIIPVFSIRERVGKVRVMIEEAIEVEQEPGSVRGDHPAMVKLASVIARNVQAHPTQWHMMYPVWCEDIDEAAPAAKA